MLSTARLTLTALLLAALTACPDDKPSGTGPEGSGQEPRRPLYERAVEALGGRERLAAVTYLETRSSVTESGRVRAVTSITRRPDRCRLEIETGIAEIVLGQGEQGPWATLDGMPTTVGKADERGLAQHLALVEMGLLAGLETHEGCRIEETASTDGLEWLEVQFREEGLGPYRLGFDPQSARLQRVDWRERTGGREQAIRLELSDYREVDGIWTAFRGRFLTETGIVLAENVVETMSFTPPTDDVAAAARFEGPSAPVASEALPLEGAALLAAARTHRAPLLTVAWLKVEEGGEGLATARDLDAWIDRQKIVRTGPTMVLFSEGQASRAAVPVLIAEGTEWPAGEESDPQLGEMPAAEALSWPLPRDASENEAAMTRVLAAAKTGLSLPIEAALSPRLVLWTDEHVLIQVPVQR